MFPASAKTTITPRRWGEVAQNYLACMAFLSMWLLLAAGLTCWASAPKSIHELFQIEMRFGSWAIYGIEVLLASQPLQPSEEYFDRLMADAPFNDVIVYPLHPEFVQHHYAFNRIIEEVAMDTGALFVDNERALGGDKRYFVDLIHYSELGVVRLARNYCDFLMAHYRSD